GERAALALSEIAEVPAVGTYGTTWTGPSDAALEVCRGKVVYLWPDNDDVGRRHMQQLGARLVTVAKAVHVVDPPQGAEPGWDIADAGEDAATLAITMLSTTAR